MSWVYVVMRLAATKDGEEAHKEYYNPHAHQWTEDIKAAGDWPHTPAGFFAAAEVCERFPRAMVAAHRRPPAPRASASATPIASRYD